jgi:hypothetical protein
MLDELKTDLYSVLDRVKLRARLADRVLDAYDIERVEALMGQIEVFTRQHHSNCE